MCSGCWASRVIVVPIVNPEGFNTSREAAADRRRARWPNETANLVVPYEYQRKNCRLNNTAEDDFESTADDDPEDGDCSGPASPTSVSRSSAPTPTATTVASGAGRGRRRAARRLVGDYAQDYRGTGPFSEPETRNVRDLVASRQVTTLITNHTFSNLLLRPPAIAAQGPRSTTRLGRSDATWRRTTATATSPATGLYDTSGGTEDWTYYSTGGLGFTFEIGPTNFHPEFAKTVAEYEGGAGTAGEGKGGNREAYFEALENTANPQRHSVISGGAPAGAVLRLKKSFQTSTSPIIDNNDEVVHDRLRSPTPSRAR